MVQIEADYPGASAEVVADSVARPIELQLPGIDNLLYFDSTSTNDGHMTIRLTFEIGTDVDIAQVQAQNRQKLAEPQLPPRSSGKGSPSKKCPRTSSRSWCFNPAIRSRMPSPWPISPSFA